LTVTNEEPIQNHQPRSMFSTWIGVVLLFAIFGLLALVIVRASPRGDSYEANRAKAREEKLEKAQKENMPALTTYGWIDKTKGVARIPIEHAMQLTMAELAQKKPAAANPIAAAEASPAAQTAAGPATPATSPGASATPTPAASASPGASSGNSPKPSAVDGIRSENRNQPAAAANPPSAPPHTQPGPSATPGGSPLSAAAKAPVSPTASPTPAAPGTPLPVRGKTP
jgi:hypothetical protein